MQKISRFLNLPQPWPDRQDEELRKAFIIGLQKRLQDPAVEIWYCDEMGVAGDPRPRRRWAKKGSKPKVTHNGDHVRMNVTGVVSPRTGQFYALEFSHTDTAVFQIFLNHASKDLKFERSRNLLLMDNASWHKKRNIDWGNFEPLYLPPYSPDLNPIERLWLLVKAQWFTDFIAKTRAELMQRLDKALVWLTNRTQDNQITCTIKQKL
jgi:transposase